METNKILNADLLDIVFEGRNKEYGAYQLRKSYNRRLTYSLAAMFGVCLLAIAGSVLGKPDGNGRPKLIVQGEVDLAALPPDKPVPPPPPPPPPPKQQVEQVNVTPPVIVKDPVVTPPPVNDQPDDVKLGDANVHGKLGDIVDAPVEVSTMAAKPLVDGPDYTKEVFIVQIQAQYPGGPAAWMKYLTRNLKQELPADNGAPAGQYKVEVSFLVDRDGNVTEVKADNDPGYGVADEAVRVIQRSGKWTPAQQNSHPVIYRQRQVIIFQVSDAQ